MSQGIRYRFCGFVDEPAVQMLLASDCLRQALSICLRVVGEPRRRNVANPPIAAPARAETADT
jgi:hypothetical protein